MHPTPLFVACLAAATVAAVGLAATAARGHLHAVRLGGVVGLAVIAALAALSAWAMLATWQDAGGYVSAAVLTGLWCWPAYYTLDEQAAPGISQRLTALVRARPWAAVVFVALMVVFVAHILTGWP